MLCNDDQWPPWYPWVPTTKGDARCRALADLHYTRVSVGHPQWTRPGYSAVLHAGPDSGGALFVWWRPKWEDGRPGTSRKDGLRVLECTHFRRTPGCALPISSTLIVCAEVALFSKEVQSALHLESAGTVEGLLTGVGSKQTERGRGRSSPPGACFLHAGWVPFEKRPGRADVWLWRPMPAVYIPERG